MKIPDVLCFSATFAVPPLSRLLRKVVSGFGHHHLIDADNLQLLFVRVVVAGERVRFSQIVGNLFTCGYSWWMSHFVHIFFFLH